MKIFLLLGLTILLVFVNILKCEYWWTRIWWSLCKCSIWSETLIEQTYSRLLFSIIWFGVIILSWYIHWLIRILATYWTHLRVLISWLCVIVAHWNLREWQRLLMWIKRICLSKLIILVKVATVSTTHWKRIFLWKVTLLILLQINWFNLRTLLEMLIVRIRFIRVMRHCIRWCRNFISI